MENMRCQSFCLIKAYIAIRYSYKKIVPKQTRCFHLTMEDNPSLTLVLLYRHVTRLSLFLIQQFPH